MDRARSIAIPGLWTSCFAQFPLSDGPGKAAGRGTLPVASSSFCRAAGHIQLRHSLTPTPGQCYSTLVTTGHHRTESGSLPLGKVIWPAEAGADALCWLRARDARRPDPRARWLSRQSAANGRHQTRSRKFRVSRLPHAFTRPTCPELLRTAGGPCRPQVFTVAAPLGGLFRRSASTDWGERIVSWKAGFRIPAALVPADGGMRNVPRALRSVHGRVDRSPADEQEAGRRGWWRCHAAGTFVGRSPTRKAAERSPRRPCEIWAAWRSAQRLRMARQNGRRDRSVPSAARSVVRSV
jgi:hypothetical protein